MKSRILGFLVAVLILALGSTVISANEIISAAPNEVGLSEKMEFEEITPFTDYLILDDTIGSSGRIWDQPSGYSYYRIHVVNTTNQTMKVTIKYGSNSHTFNVSANSSETKSYSNAQANRHTVSFSTPNGVVSGTVAVRVSDGPLA